MKRQIWRFLLWLRFQLFQRHRFNQLVLEEVGGKPFLVLPEVFNPTLFLTSKVMVQMLSPALIPQGSTVLDMGTGSGIGAIFMAQWAERVTAVDVNPAAVRCARINVLLNHLEERVCVWQGDLFEPLMGKKFDVILFNPPFLLGEPRNWLDHAFRNPMVLERFAAEAATYLKPNGSILLLLASDAPIERILALFEEQGYVCQVVAARDLVSEVVTLYQLQL